MNSSPRTWVVTGASGQLGSELVRRLTELGHRVIGLSHEEFNIAGRKSIENALDVERLGYVINAAAYTNVDEAETDVEKVWATNACGPQMLAEVIRRRPNAFLAHISTDYVFGFPRKLRKPWGECASVNPLNEYGKSKAAGEKAVRDTLLGRSVIVRTAWLYAPGHGNFVSTMVDRALAGSPSSVVDDQWGQPTYARDVAEYVVNVVSRLADGQAPAGTYHATNSGRATWFDVARRVYERTGADVRLVNPIASAETSRVAIRPPWSVLGHDAWSRAGLPPPRPWEQALDEALPEFLGAKTSEC